MNNFIKLSNISKSFTHQKNLKDLKKLTYNFKLGKIYSLMGPSGSGKSTLLNLLSLIDRPSSYPSRWANRKFRSKNSEKCFWSFKKTNKSKPTDNLCNS